MLTAIINLVSTLAVCFTVLAVSHMAVNTYLAAKGITTISRTGLVNWLLNLLVQRIEKVTGIDIPGYGCETPPQMQSKQ